MHPNEQDPGLKTPITPAPNPAQPLPYAVPEYLHLDPVTGQQQHFKIPRKLILIAAVLLLVVSGVFGSYQLWQFNQPQTRFYRALENNFKVSYVERQYTATVTGDKLQADIKTDFTNSAVPKSLINLQSQLQGVKPYKVDYVVPGTDVYMARVHEGDLGIVSTIVTDGEWYQMRDSSTNMDTINYSLDQLPTLRAYNTSQGLLPMGNFNSRQRSQLMDYIKANDVYTMTKATDQQNSTEYTVSLNIDTLNNLNKKVAAALGVKQAYVASTAFGSIGELRISVDNKSDKIQKMVYTVPNGNGFLFQGTSNYSYPTSLSITLPSDSKKLPGGVQL